MIEQVKSVPYEKINTIQNNVYDKKADVQEKQEAQKEVVRSAAVTSAQIQQTENVINAYYQSNQDEGIDLAGSNLDYKEINNKYNEYSETKKDFASDLSTQLKEYKENINEEKVEIQSKGHFVDLTV